MMIRDLDLRLESYGGAQFLFLAVPAGMELDGMAVEQIASKQTQGLLPCAVLQKDEAVYVRYDQISDRTLADVFSGTLTKQLLTTNLLNVMDSLLDLQQTGLDLENLLLNKQYIFLDHFSNRLAFVYVPVTNNVFEKVSMKGFISELLTAAPYDEADDLLFYIKLVNYIASQTDLNLIDFQKKLTELAFIKDVSTKAEPELAGNFYSPGKIEAATAIENGMLTSEYSSRKTDKKSSQKLEIEEEVQYKRITRTELGEGESLLKGAASLGGTSINIIPKLGHDPHEDEGTTVLTAGRDEEEEGTTALGVSHHISTRPFFITAVSKEKIEVAKNEFKIGRDPEQADYVSKNKVVGRVHAKVITENGEYFLVDQQSKNGSYLNGTKVLPYKKTKIKHDDHIRLGNEEFVFRMF
ncbi:FHA domain-containing protein [Neobacillus kokaensis]|uniref:FHA domain-containing protein n=1 Tax=Neobacillus kokaensis TaxID=2759023 RepID=A0ABQ3N1D1_9BACI|nr:FHA domain-containing protein [Neobacillus kokaensis]GHH98738.1 hypothetical protein AM1BK_22810 [Neobacillus kokaensis]